MADALAYPAPSADGQGLCRPEGVALYAVWGGQGRGGLGPGGVTLKCWGGCGVGGAPRGR